MSSAFVRNCAIALFRTGIAKSKNVAVKLAMNWKAINALTFLRGAGRTKSTFRANVSVIQNP